MMATNFSANIEWTFLSDVEITEKIGAYLKQMRLNKNMSQVEVAIFCGVDRLTIANLENGKPVKFTTIIAFLRALGELNTLNSFIVSPIFDAEKIIDLSLTLRKKASKKNPKT